jgi:outer membrane immunogenic protein
MPLKAPPPAPVFSWLGLYFGVNGGYGWSQSQTVVDTEWVNNVQILSTTAAAGSRSLGGGFGGVQVGANFYQWNNWLLGVEADFQLGDIRGASSAVVPNFLPGGLIATINTSNRVGAFGTARGRIGYAWDSTLLYVTGGFSWGRTDYRFQYTDNFNFNAAQDFRHAKAGYVVGGGVEQALTWWDPNLSVKVEYQYINLGTQHYVAPLFFGAVNTVFAENQDVRTDFHTVRVGLNYRFSGFDAPPAPRMLTKAPPVPEPVVNWTGLYFGINAGAVFSHVDAFVPGGNPALQIAGVPGGGYTIHNDNALVGVQVGLQYQWGSLVAGIEGNWSTSLNGNGSHDELCPKQSIALFNCGARIREIQTAGGRLGWSLGRWLPYVSGGYASAPFHAEVTNRSLQPIGARILWWDNRATGWYAGAGLDWLAAPDVVLGIEYRHYDFGSRTLTPLAIVGGGPGLLPNDTTRFGLQADSITFRASVKLGPIPAPPVTAKY